MQDKEITCLSNFRVYDFVRHPLQKFNPCVPSYSNKKLEIVNFEDQDHLLNKCSELISKCRHSNNYLKLVSAIFIKFLFFAK